MRIHCDACGADMELSPALGMRCLNRPRPCPQCADAVAMELEQGMAELVSQGKAVVTGKTDDGRNLYQLVEG